MMKFPSIVSPEYALNRLFPDVKLLLLNRTQSIMKKKLKNTKIQEQMHKTHSHRQVNSVNYLELEQTAVIQLMINCSIAVNRILFI